MDTNQFTFNVDLQVRWMDLDPLQHINNSIYIQYFELGRGKYMSQAVPSWDWHKNMFLIANISCDYIKELTMTHRNPKVWARTSRFGTKSFDLEYLVTSEGEDGKDIVHAKGQSTQVMFDMQNRKTIEVYPWMKKEIEAFEV